MNENDEEVAVVALPATSIDVQVIEVPDAFVTYGQLDVTELDPAVRDAQGTGDQTGGMGAL